MSSKYILLFIVLVIFVNHSVSWIRRRRRRCPRVDCQVSHWSSWSACDVVRCGQSGTRRRTRILQRQPHCGGTPCPSLVETAACQGATPVDCKLSAWSTWSACSVACGGSQTSTRYIVTNEQCGGTPCSSIHSKRRPCSLSQCLNLGTMVDGKCSCPPGYYGSCCQYNGK